MGWDEIFALVAKGLQIIDAVSNDSSAVKKAVIAVENIVNKATSGTPVSQKDLDDTESTLDALLDEFNKPMED